MTDGTGMQRLLDIMARLRDPENGCPWDLKQTYKTITPHTIEEAYEVADCIERDDLDHLPGELGDFLFQVAFYAQLAKEENRFEFQDIVDSICDKLVRRHPHVFADHRFETIKELSQAWEGFKEKERVEREKGGVFADIPTALPALSRSRKIQARAIRQGFDWKETCQAVAKIDEELNELKEEIGKNSDHADMEHELGDLLFTCVGLARRLNIDPEQALRKANDRFMRRFEAMQELVENNGKNLQDCSLETMLAYWNKTKS